MSPSHYRPQAYSVTCDRHVGGRPAATCNSCDNKLHIKRRLLI